MNTFSSDDIQALRKAEKLFSRKTRKCNLWHENFEDDDDSGMVPPLRDECADDIKHFGCPHFLEQYMGLFSVVMDILSKQGDEECIQIKRLLEAMTLRQRKIDSNVRNVRMGGLSHKKMHVLDIPTMQEAHAASEPYINKFNANCDRLDILRIRALAKIRTSLQLEAES